MEVRWSRGRFLSAEVVGCAAWCRGRHGGQRRGAVLGRYLMIPPVLAPQVVGGAEDPERGDEDDAAPRVAAAAVDRRARPDEVKRHDGAVADGGAVDEEPAPAAE